MTTYGYARVSTRVSKSKKNQHPENQEARLREAGAENVYTDWVSGTKASRPEWDKLLARLQPGDVLLFTKLDRIGRSLINLVDVMRLLGQRGVSVRSLDQGEFDTTTAHGKLIFTIMSALAEYERDLLAERTTEGLESARERHGGQLPVRGPSIRPDQVQTAQMLASTTDMSAQRIAEVIGVSRATLYRHVAVGALRLDRQ